MFGVEVAVEGPPAILQYLRAQTYPFFAADRRGARPDYILSLYCRETKHWLGRLSRIAPGLSVPIDTSRYAHLTSEGISWSFGRRRIVLIEATGSFVRVEVGRRTVAVYHSDEEFLQLDALRVLKSIMSMAGEGRGLIQLHASGVATPAGAVLFVGDSGNGKTTLLLEAVASFNLDQLSCDTVVVSRSELSQVAQVAGWPSPFSVSHGTLADYPKLSGFMPPERRNVAYDKLWREGKKSVLTSEQVMTAMGREIACAPQPLAACVFITFNPAAKTQVVISDSVEDALMRLSTAYLGSCDPIYPDWMLLSCSAPDDIRRNLRALASDLVASGRAYIMDWAPGPASLLKRLPVIESCLRRG